MMYRDWEPYVSVAERRRRAEAQLAKRLGKGQVLEPIVIQGRTIARTPWGKAWCANLEVYSDYANRVPRGRTYVRNGSVLDLKVKPGRVDASVAGSKLYTARVVITPLSPERWKQVCAECAGGIDSLVELLAGRFDAAVMERLCRPHRGLFPEPKEIEMSCSCPDGASMCKHLSATLYGVGARLDEDPELLFVLRQVDPTDLLAGAGKGLETGVGPGAERALDTDDLGAMFGLEFDDLQAPSTPASPNGASAQGPRARSSIGKGAAKRATAATDAVAAASKSKAPVEPAPRSRALASRSRSKASADPPPLDVRLLALLQERGWLDMAKARAALEEEADVLRPLLQSLVDRGLATKRGTGRWMKYHLVR